MKSLPIVIVNNRTSRLCSGILNNKNNHCVIENKG